LAEGPNAGRRQTPASGSLARLALSDGIRERRRALGLSQAALARRMNSSQSRVAKIEAGDPAVSLDLMARAFFETGASVSDLGAAITQVENRRTPP
jgi:transcriptional regulator with XRE-family HTH domain